MLYEVIAQEIIDLQARDLTLRNQLLQAEALNEGYHPEMEAVHLSNAAALERIIDRIGYPTEAKVGAPASSAAWLVIQHAISRPDFMVKCLKLLELAVERGEANPLPLAYLSDRIAVYQNQPQRYGTQFDWDDNGVLSPQPYDDAAEVDRRRQALGLNSLKARTTEIRATAQRENQLPPANLLAHRAGYEAWRRKVGWLTVSEKNAD